MHQRKRRNSNPKTRAKFPKLKPTLCLRSTRKGEGVKASTEKGNEWLLKAAEAGFPSAMFNLHLAIESGEYTPPEKRKESAVKRRKRDADLQKRDADTEGEDADVQGGGNADLALHWLEKAAAAQHPKALYNLAMRLRDG